MVFGSDAVDPSGWDGGNKDSLFAAETSPPGQLAQQWELRMLAQEAAVREAADSQLYRLLAHNRSFNCTYVAMGDPALFHDAVNHANALGWRGPAAILDTDETGATVKFHSQKLEVAGSRKQMGEKDVGEVEWDPASGSMLSWDGSPKEDLEQVQKFDGFPWEGTPFY